MSLTPQNPVDATKRHQEVLDPSCFFDPDMLLPSQQAGFHLLFPDWEEKSILNRPTIRDMQLMLKEVDLTRITKRSVFLADTALTPSPYAPSTEKDTTSYQKFSRIPIDTQASSTFMDSADPRGGRAFESRHGLITVNEIVDAIHYLKGMIATGPLRQQFDYFLKGLMATRLEDIQFAFTPNERETLKETLEKVRSNGLQNTNDAVDVILAAVGYNGDNCNHGIYGVDNDNDEILEMFSLISARKSNNPSFKDLIMYDTDIEWIDSWLSGDVVQRRILCEIIARHLFGVTKVLPMADHISLNRTIKDAVALCLFGEFEKYKITFPKQAVTLEELVDKGYNIDVGLFVAFSVDNRKIKIGKLSYTQMRIALCLCPEMTPASALTSSPVYELLRIYCGLCGTPSSFKLAVDMGIIDYDDYTAVKFILVRYSYWCITDDVTSQHGYEYARLCRDFYSLPRRVRRDFSNSITRDAFALLVTVAAFIVSTTGIFQVVQGFVNH